MERVAFSVLMFFVFAIPWQNFILIEGIGTISRAIGLATVPISILAIAQQGRIRKLGLTFGMMLVFVWYVALSFVWSHNHSATLVHVLTYTQLVIMVFIFCQWIDTERRYRWILQAYIFGCCVLSFNLLQSYFLLNISEYSTRLSAQNVDPNELSATLVVGIPIAWYLANSSSKRGLLEFVNLTITPLFVICILLTASRGGTIAMIVALSMLILSFAKSSIVIKIITIIFMILLVTNIQIIVPESTWNRLSELTRLGESNWGYRRVIWEAGLKIFAQYPILGTGAGTHKYVLVTVLAGFSAHNVVMSILVQLGTVGMIIFSIIINIHSFISPFNKIMICFFNGIAL